VRELEPPPPEELLELEEELLDELLLELEDELLELELDEELELELDEELEELPSQLPLRVQEASLPGTVFVYQPASYKSPW